MPTFLSASRMLRVTFPPEQFGMGEGVEQFFDANGNRMSKKLPHRAAKFENGQLREEKPHRVEMLRKHPGNMANKGTDFWEQSQADSIGIAAIHGKPNASMPDGGLSAEDIADLVYLKKAEHNIPPPVVDKFRKAANRVHERLKILGLAAPPPEFNTMRLRARIVEMLGVIAECNIWDGENAESKPMDSRSGKRADG